MPIWKSEPPTNCPFLPSTEITGVNFTGRHIEYTGADTWYPYWAADDICYTPWTDGNFDRPVSEGFDLHNMDCSSDSRNHSNRDIPGRSRTGQARILGADPLNLSIENLGLHIADPRPYEGRYPCGSIVHDGVWYYGTYLLDESDRGLNWDILGPFMGFRMSYDLGKTWTDTPHIPANGGLFGETGKGGGKVKIGAPHFVYFGQANQYSPDAKAYLVAHGASHPDSEAAWIAGDEAYLLRVTPSPATINDPNAYEFYGGQDAAGQPIWTPNFSEIAPLIQWRGHVGHANMTYIPALRKYLLIITDGWPTTAKMHTYILESDHITGPWKLVTFMKDFGVQAYFVNIPPKFVSEDGKTMWLCYSANFSNLPGVFNTQWEANPPGSAYAMCWQEITLEMR